MYPLLITERCRHTHFYDEFWRKTTHFLLFVANFWITHPCLWKICRKKDPCLENLGPKNPPLWAAHTRTLNMLCTPPRGASLSFSQKYCRAIAENAIRPLIFMYHEAMSICLGLQLSTMISQMPEPFLATPVGLSS